MSNDHRNSAQQPSNTIISDDINGIQNNSNQHDQTSSFQSAEPLLQDTKSSNDETTETGDGWDQDEEDLLLLDDDEADENDSPMSKLKNEESCEGANVSQPTEPTSETIRISNAPQQPTATSNQAAAPSLGTEESVTPPPPWDVPKPTSNVQAQKADAVTADWVYDPETDIIPTRKRWKNPHPGPRRLSQLLTGGMQ